MQEMQESVIQKNKKLFTTRNLARMGILTALSYVLYMFVKFPLPIFPSFLDVQFSDIPALLGGFAMGPFAGALIVVAKCLLKLPFSGTGGVGELGDILIGIAFCLPAALCYAKFRTKKGALVGLIIGLASSIAVAVLVNRVILVPFYVQMLTDEKVSGWTILTGMLSALYNKTVTQDNFYTYYLLAAVIPFNLLRGVIVSGLTFALYKPLARFLHD